MNNDAVVEDVRKARQAYAARFKYDLKAMGEDLRRREAESARAGRKIVTLPPRRSHAHARTKRKPS